MRCCHCKEGLPKASFLKQTISCTACGVQQRIAPKATIILVGLIVVLFTFLPLDYIFKILLSMPIVVWYLCFSFTEKIDVQES